MNAEDFVKWFNGYLDASGESLGKESLEVIKEKLASVEFKPASTPPPFTFPPVDTTPRVWPQPVIRYDGDTPIVALPKRSSLN
jgi:hypothetical protein